MKPHATASNHRLMPCVWPRRKRGRSCLGIPGPTSWRQIQWSHAAAVFCLELLSGRRHRVHGGIALASPGDRLTLRRVDSQVAFKRLSEAEITDYLCCGEWRGKAGGYAIQGRAAALIRWVRGSYTNVVGLPLFETAQLLAGRGYPMPCSANC